MSRSKHGTLVEGRIVAVQEQRFRLQTDEGQVLLLVLGPEVSIGDGGLQGLRASRARVTVTFTGQPNLAGCVAHNVLVGG